MWSTSPAVEAQFLADEGLVEQATSMLATTSTKAPSPAAPKALTSKQEKQRRKKEEKRKAQQDNPSLKAATSNAAQLKKLTQQYNVAAKTQIKLPIDYTHSFCGRLSAKRPGERLDG